MYKDFQSCGYLIPTNKSKKWIPDEAYTASSIATGYPVKEGSISMDSTGSALSTFFDIARESHKKTGLITNASLSYITPACFTTHSPNWEDEYTFAEKQLETDLDLLFGGGQKFFMKNDNIEDFQNTIGQRGYQYINQLAQIDIINPALQKVIGLFAEEEIEHSESRDINLEKMTKTALDFLDSRRGFVLLINDTHLDWYSHQKQERNILLELNNISSLMETIVDYQKKHSNTLIVFIGAYDCGGYSVTESVQYGDKGQLKQVSRKHTANFTPILARGRYHHKFNQIMTPAQLGTLLKKIAAN
jgi:alkaline phosphatase